MAALRLVTVRGCLRFRCCAEGWALRDVDPTGLASRFDNRNPHGFSGFVEANSRCYLSQCFVAASAKRLNRKRMSRRVD